MAGRGSETQPADNNHGFRDADHRPVHGTPTCPPQAPQPMHEVIPRRAASWGHQPDSGRLLPITVGRGAGGGVDLRVSAPFTPASLNPPPAALRFSNNVPFTPKWPGWTRSRRSPAPRISFHGRQLWLPLLPSEVGRMTSLLASWHPRGN